MPLTERLHTLANFTQFIQSSAPHGWPVTIEEMPDGTSHEMTRLHDFAVTKPMVVAHHTSGEARMIIRLHKGVR